jgi:hypothetical protein
MAECEKDARQTLQKWRITLPTIVQNRKHHNKPLKCPKRARWKAVLGNLADTAYEVKEEEGRMESCKCACL